PLVPGALMPGGARVPGTSLELDPPQAAFCNGLLLCRCSGHAADPVGGILAVADYQARKAMMEGKTPPTVRELLAAILKALQIQGILAFEGGRQETGHATLRSTRIATAAVAAAQLGGTQRQIITALSHACGDADMSVDADDRYDVARWTWITADAINRAVRHACHAIAAGQSIYLTPPRLQVMDLAGKSLGAPGPAAGPRVSAGIPEPLLRLYRPSEMTPIMTRFQTAVDRHFPARHAERIKALFAKPERLDGLPVNELLAALVTNGAQ
ncbi:MAG: MmgE/PrpD family protein, partial [Steroidobacteraceae bacterium]